MDSKNSFNFWYVIYPLGIKYSDLGLSFQALIEPIIVKVTVWPVDQIKFAAVEKGTCLSAETQMLDIGCKRGKRLFH